MPEIEKIEIAEIPVQFEQLEELEEEFEEVELEIYRQKDKLSKDLYAKRAKIVSEIPSFWGLVFEQAPEEFENVFIPEDSELFGALKNLTVERFDLPDGDPRNLLFRWEFEENEYFENKILEKKFIRRQDPKSDLTGFVSEPVEIKWKQGKDLTNGLTDLVLKVHAEELAGKADEETDAKKELKKKIESTPLGTLSFFAWFGYRGPRISEEEHKEALKKEAERRQARKEGKEEEDEEMEDEDEDDVFEKAFALEIYPSADELAITIAEDIWPDAIRMFLQAQDQDGLSELDFEEIDEDDEEDDEMNGDEKKGDSPPNKKRKA